MKETSKSVPEDAVALRRGIVGAWMVLVLGTLALFAPVGEFAFVNYDDNVFVYENPHVLAGFTADSVRWAFTSADIDYWRPLCWLSHMLDVELFGLNAGGHHLMSVLIHALAAGMLFSFLRQMTGRLGGSFMVAALFAWHPLHVESVAWIAERKDVLCGLFWFAALYFYARYARTGGAGNYAGLLIAFVAGLMSKPMIITLPFQLLLLDLWPLRRVRLERGDPWRRLLLEKLPLFVLVLAACAMTYLAQHQVGTVASTDSLTIGRRLLNVPEAYLTYLWKMVFPISLAVFYPLNVAVNWTGSGLGLLAVTGGSWFALSRLRTSPFVFVGWCWFVGTLVPVVGLVQVGAQRAADRYTYIALVGLFMVAVWGIGGMIRDTGRRRLLAGVVLAVCLVRTHFQIDHWRDGRTLFRHALSVTGDSHLALYNLARLHLTDGEFVEAADLLRRAERLLPNSPELLLNLGTALHEGRISADEAERCYRDAALLDPDNPAPINNLANLLSETGRAEAALPLYLEAQRRAPRYFRAFFNQAGLLMDLKRLAEAEVAYRKALELEPKDLKTRTGLIDVVNQLGRVPEAAALAEETARLHPDNFEANYNAAALAEAVGRAGAALGFYERALQINPGFPPAIEAVARLRGARRPL
ncbi:MAG: tetratricopeptide repeat protein [Verrucomicrobiae bacterium]|nr:tetratricopeptide repeat protein [Verrucomicrobiae bacterium]